jgi:hypothetical protein
MDGSQASKLFQGRKISPISTYFAVTALPQWVYDMFQSSGISPKVSVDHSSDVTGNTIVLLRRGTGVGPLAQIWLIESDYRLVQHIIRTLPMPLFPQESQQSIMNRIRGALRVQFAGRGTFDGQDR